MSAQKRVLIVAGTLDMGGLENQLVYVGKHIDHEKFAISYTSTKEDAYYKNDVISANCEYIVVPDPRADGLIKYCVKMYKVMKNGKYDVVHSQELFHSGIEMFLAWLAKVPKRISHSHSTQDGSNHNKTFKKIYHGIMRKMILLFSTDYLACSTMAGEFLYGENIKKNRKFQVVFNSVDTKEYFVQEKSGRTVFEKKEGWKYIVHVGRFSEVKNHKFMLELAEYIKQAELPLSLVFVGDGELFSDIQKQASEANVLEHVRFLGQRRDVAAILKQADAFILPSFYEGMPLSIIEAQAAGLPCLIADHITNEVDFSTGQIHRLPVEESPQIWVEKLVDLLKEKHWDSDIIREAIEKKGFDVSDFQRRLCDIYLGE